MSTIKSSDEHLTLNADGISKDIKLQSNASEKVIVKSTGNVGINNSAPTQRLEINGNSQLNAYDNTSGSGGYSTSGLQIGNAFDAGLSGGNDDRNSIVWNERGLDMLFGTSNTERMRIDYNGNVGIGTSPSYKLHTLIGAGEASGVGILNTSGQGLNIYTDSTASNADVSIDQGATGAGMIFRQNGTERMRVDGSGRLLVNRSSANATEQVQINHTGASQYGTLINSTSGGTGTQYHMSWARGDTQCGYLTSSPTSIGLNNASDERLKENIQDSASATQDIKNIKVRQFDWKDNRDAHKDYGFVAQELVTVVPEAVAVGSDELNEDGTPVQIWGVDESKLIPRLVKTIQELEARITALEA